MLINLFQMIQKKNRMLYACLGIVMRNYSKQQTVKKYNTTLTIVFQDIKEGQHISKGLHVRVNMQTGQKEAKLLDPNENNEENSIIPVIDHHLQNKDSESSN